MWKRLGMNVLIIVLCGLLLVGCSTPRQMQITDVWARPAIAGDNSAVYLVIDNTGITQADRLISAQTTVCRVVELHQTRFENNVMMMEPQNAVEVAAKTKVEFKPGGLHVMLIDLKQELKKGDIFTLTLQFEKAGSLDVQVNVMEQ